MADPDVTTRESGSEADSRDSVRAQPPAEASPAAIVKPESVAGGVGAIASTLKHGVGKMGLARTVKTLTTVNQTSGFDCPGCAWPDPAEHRSIAEFCENGAKAVADEAMTARIDLSFFAEHSVPE